jgi:uncharacterized membrane protein
MIKRNLLVLILLLSVGINILLVGGIAVRVSNSRDFREARPLPPNIGWIVRDLSEARRAELMEIMRPSAEQVLPLRRSMFDAQRRVNELMAASDYDEAALAEALSELREASEAYTSFSHQQTIRLLGELSEEERQAAMEFVQRRGPRDGSDGFQRPRPGGPDDPARRGPPGPGFPPPPDGDL